MSSYARTCTYAVIVAQDRVSIVAMISLEKSELPFSKMILLSTFCVSPETLNLNPIYYYYDIVADKLANVTFLCIAKFV